MKSLPDKIDQLLTARDAPPRLRAHLMLVHDVASQLLNGVEQLWPALKIDNDAVLFGAAAHDVGKIVYPNELVGPGSEHENAGVALLLNAGFPEHLARFARTHGQWNCDDCALEDMMVALADKVWRGKRDDALEHGASLVIANQLGLEQWEAWLPLDDMLTQIAATSEWRLCWQSQFS